MGIENINWGEVSQIGTGTDTSVGSTSDMTGLVLDEAMKKNPDQMAKVKSLSSKSGLPEPVVEANPDQVERDIHINDINPAKLAKESPHTHALISDYNSATVAYDDTKKLSSLEKLLTPAASAAQGTLGVEESLLRIPSGVESSFTYLSQLLENKTGLPAAADPLRGLETIARGYHLALAPLTDRFRQAQKVLPQIAEPFKRVGLMNQKGEDTLNSAMKGDYGPMLDMLTNPEALSSYAANALPSMIVAMAGGGVFRTTAALEGGSELSSQAQHEADTGKPISAQDKTLAFTQTALVNGLLERYGINLFRRFPIFKKFFKQADEKGIDLNKVTDALESKGVRVKDIIAVGLGEGLTEVAQQFNQNLAEKTTYDPKQSLTSGMLQSFIGGHLAGTVAGSAGYVADKAQRSKYRSELEQLQIDSVNAAATDSKTRARSPETFKQFVKSAAGEQNVYIAAGPVKAYLQEKSPEDVAADPMLKLMSDQIDNASELGADVVVPIEDFATHMAGTEHYDALRAHMTLSQDSVSPYQQQQKTQENADATFINNLVEEANKSASEYVEAQDIYNTHRDQIIDTGRMSPKDASVAAQLYPALITVKAKELGKSVKDTYEMFGLTVRGPQTGVADTLAAHAAGFKFNAPEVASAVDTNGGVTLNRDGSNFTGTTGYIATVRSKNIDNLDNLEQELSSFRNENAKLLGYNNGLVGVFKLSDGRYSLDMNVHTNDRAKAVEIGKKNNQESIYDVANKKTISTGGKSGPGLDLAQAEKMMQDIGGTYDTGTGRGSSLQQTAGTTENSSGNAREEDGSLQGLPRINGAASSEAITNVAEKYMADAGLPYFPPNRFAPVDEERATRIAQAYDDMEHDPADPEVKAAYDALIKETIAQYNAILDAGLNIEFVPEGVEYPYEQNPRMATEDVTDNSHLWVFSTREGFGSDDTFDPVDNPLLQETKFKISGQTALVNDLFRVVHDYFGHVKEGVGFRAAGEENAWRAHSAMFSPLARKALTSETRGQNSWVNFGPYGTQNRTASGADTHYADQKIGLLPQWAIDEGRNDAVTQLGDIDVPVDANGNIRLTHHSHTENLSLLDPSKHGTGMAGRERQRKRDNPMAWVDRTYYGIEEGTADDYKPEPETGPVTYHTFINPESLYDATADPDGLKKNSTDFGVFDTTVYEKNIRDAGYSGYWVNDKQQGLVVAAFDKAPVNGVIGDTTYKQSVPLRRQTQTLRNFGLDPTKKHTTREVAAALEARTRKKFGKIKESDRSPEASKKIAKWMVQEVLFELETPDQSATGWYTAKFQNALDTFAERFPELKDDKNARDMLTLFIAITSDGQKVVPNFKQAANIYERFRKDGSLGSNRETVRQGSVDSNLKVIGDLLQTMSIKELHDYLLHEDTVSSLRRMAKKAGVEFKTDYQAQTKLPRAALVLGPKLGAFYANLMGEQGYLTMDRWWVRTFNRYRGTILPKVVGTANRPTDSKGNKIGLAKFKELIGQPELSDDEALSYVAKHHGIYEARKYKNGTPIEKSANTLYKAAFSEIATSPNNASERTFMIDTVERARKSLKRRGHDLTTADIQAILWYYEKRLYGDLGARKSADVSYEEAAKRAISNDRLAGQDIQSRAAATPIGENIYNQEAGVIKGEYNPTQRLINLTEASDLSTFLHEFAHFALDMERRFPTGNRLQSIDNWYKRNAESVAKEAGFNDMSITILANHVREFIDNGTTGDKRTDSAIDRAIHEQFARGFETYLMEGKAPSVELRNAFRTFARWLVQVYHAIKGDLKVNLDPEMRQVFDRMLATEEQIAMAEARTRFEPMFTDAAMAGATEEEYAAYLARQEKMKDKSTETLRDKIIGQLTRQTKKWWKEEKADVIDEEVTKLKSERVYVAMNTLRNGKIKLNHAAVKDAYGEVVTNKLGKTQLRIPPKLVGMTKKGGEGVDPDEAAAFLGYSSGDEMVKEIVSAENINKLADTRAEEIMKERHGDILHDGTIMQEADEAVRNEERGKLILQELKFLSRGTNQAAIDRQTLKSLAEHAIGKQSFRKINPARYRKAELRAAQESAAALAKGDKEAAAEAKQRQALNYYLGMAATAAKNDTMKIVDRMARYRKKQVQLNIAKAENGYWEQLQKILSRFEFRRSATLKKVDAVNQGLAEWVKERVEQDGDGLVLSAAVLDQSYITHWKNVPYSDLVGIADSVKNIEYVARYSNKMNALKTDLEFKELVQKWVGSMNERVKSVFKPQRTSTTKKKSYSKFAMAQMTKIPWLASWLDGGERTGISHDTLVQPLVDAYDMEMKMWHEHGEGVINLIKNRSKADKRRHARTVFIPEIKDENNDGNLLGHQIIAVALNTGNQSNLKKLLLGEGWANPENESEIDINNPKLQAVLAHMTQSDWELVQHIWDKMEELYPMLAEEHRRTTGLTPPKIEASEVNTPFGKFRGGYYPVKYDSQRSHRADLNKEKQDAQTESMFGSFGSIQASVNASATSERTGYYGPIDLNMNVIPNHFQETIHYIAFHDPVREINKLINNAEVAATIKAKLGEEEYKRLRPWLNDVAKDGRADKTKTMLGPVLQQLRLGVTLGVMGFKVSTGLIQISGLSNTIAEVGAANTLHAVRNILGSPKTMNAAWEFARDNSKVMSHRMKTMDRELRNAMLQLEGKAGWFPAMQEASMKHIALVQTYMVDLPTWHAAYIKGMNEWGDEKRAFKYADWAVENVQGSGLTHNMAEVMRGSAETKTFTMFMTFYSSLWNATRDLKKGAHSSTTVAAKLMFMFAIPVLLDMLLHGSFGGDDDDDKSNMEKYLLNLALYPTQSVPFLRDVVNGALGDYSYNITPVAQVLSSGLQSSKTLINSMLTDKEISQRQAHTTVKNLSKIAGATFGIPGVNQAWATGEELDKVLRDGEDLTIKELLYGPKR